MYCERAQPVTKLMSYVSRINIHDLWGERRVELALDRHVNILIGRNGSGKTTILRTIWEALSFNQVGTIPFGRAEVFIQSGHDRHIMSIQRGSIGRAEIVIDGAPLSEMFPDFARYLRMRHRHGVHSNQLREAIRKSMPPWIPYVAWMPVSRRLPIPVSEEGDRAIGDPRRTNLESVDHRLRDIIEEFQDFFTSTSHRMTEFYRKFVQEVLLSFFTAHGESSLEAPTAEDQEQLEAALLGSGLERPAFELKLRKYIEDARECIGGLKKQARNIPPDTLYVMNTLSHTRHLTELAQRLNINRRTALEPIAGLLEEASSFLRPKWVSLSESGKLQVQRSKAGDPVTIEQLSSGEKQILILLTQALLLKDKSAVYMSDEPELSLHVDWQEKLLGSVLALAGETQVIVATHSPDVVGKFGANVITLDRR